MRKLAHFEVNQHPSCNDPACDHVAHTYRNKGRYHYFDGETAYTQGMVDDAVAGDDITRIAELCRNAREALQILERKFTQKASQSSNANGLVGGGVTRSGPSIKADPSKGIPTTRTQRLRESKLRGAADNNPNTLAGKAETERLRLAMLSTRPAAPTPGDPKGFALATSKWLNINGLDAQKLNFYHHFKDVCYKTHEGGLYSEYTTMCVHHTLCNITQPFFFFLNGAKWCQKKS